MSTLKLLMENLLKTVQMAIHRPPEDSWISIHTPYYRLHSPGSSITWLLGLLGDKKGSLGAKKGVIKSLKS